MTDRQQTDRAPVEDPIADGTPAPDEQPADVQDVEADGAQDAGARDAVEGEGQPTADEPVDPVAAAEAARDDYLDQLMRARADYDNLNKRRHKEVAEARDRGAAALAEGLLEVLDNFGFALKAAEASEDTSLAKGVQLVHGQLVQALQQQGLEEVPGAGAPFDPSHHEALMSESDGEDREQPEVAEVLRTGYRFRSTLLRPASVKVVE